MGHIYELKNTDIIISPSLIYYEEIIRENIRKTIRTTGSPERLWPHVESHKSKDMMRAWMEYGITRFKIATVAEAEMVAEAGTEKVTLAYSLIGPNMKRLVKLAKAYPGAVFYGAEDDLAQPETLSRVCVEHNAVLPILVDVNMGMNRTGVLIERLKGLYRPASSLPGLRLCGMHCYDGNHNNKDAAIRQVQVDDANKKVSDIMERLSGDGTCYELAAAGDTPSFPCHADVTRWYLSPGIVFIVDTGYCMDLPDLDFMPGAAVATRVISHPAKGMFTTDLGYKAIASDPAGQQGYIAGLEGAVPIMHSGEHQAFRLEDGGRIPVTGSCLYMIPTHACPTTALYLGILVAKEGQVADR